MKSTKIVIKKIQKILNSESSKVRKTMNRKHKIKTIQKVPNLDTLFCIYRKIQTMQYTNNTKYGNTKY